MRHLLQDSVQRRYVHPFAGATDIVAVVQSVGARSRYVALYQPARAVAPEHQSVVACGGIFGVGIVHHPLHHLRVAGTCVAHRDTHVGYGDRVCHLAPPDACEPGGLHIVIGLVAAYEHQYTVFVTQFLRAFLDLVQVGFQKIHVGTRQVVLASHIDEDGSLRLHRLTGSPLVGFPILIRHQIVVACASGETNCCCCGKDAHEHQLCQILHCLHILFFFLFSECKVKAIPVSIQQICQFHPPQPVVHIQDLRQKRQTLP